MTLAHSKVTDGHQSRDCLLCLLQGVESLLGNVVDHATLTAEALGEAITQHLQAASDSASQQTEVSQQSLQVPGQHQLDPGFLGSSR